MVGDLGGMLVIIASTVRPVLMLLGWYGRPSKARFGVPFGRVQLENVLILVMIFPSFFMFSPEP